MRWFCFVFLGFYLGISSSAQASAAACAPLYQQQKYEAAGRCFWDAANKMGDVSKTNDLTRFGKGRLLRNAAQSYIKAAKQSSGLQASKHYGNTLKILYQYVNEQLYENQQRKRSLQQRIKKLLQQTGFTSLQINANHPQAKICLQAQKARECQTGTSWKKLLPAGNYTISITYPDGTTRKRPAKMEAGLQLALDFYPPQTHVKVELLSQHPSANMRLSGATLPKELLHQGASWTLKLKPGTYLLKLKYPGIPELSRQVLVGVQPEQTYKFRPPSSTLQINSTPASAMIFIDGNYRGLSPSQLLVPDGTLQVVLKKGCHTISSQSVTLKPQERKEIQATLRPEAQYLEWQSGKQSSGTKRALGWVGLIGGVAILGLTTASFVLSSQARTTADNQRDLYLSNRDKPEQYLEGYTSAAAQNNTWQTIGYVSAGTGGVALALGIAGLLSRPPQARDLNCKVPMGFKPQ